MAFILTFFDSRTLLVYCYDFLEIHVKQRNDGFQGYQWKDPSCSSQSVLLAIMQKAYRTGPVHRTTTDIVRNRWDLRKAGSIDN